MQNNTHKKTFAERVSFGISLFVMGLVVALVCYTWITGDSDPPIVSVAIEPQIRKINRQYYVPFTVTNSGGSTAEAVEIVAHLAIPQQTTETGKQEIDFLSRQEERSGEFIFSHNPQEGELVIRVASYQLP